MTITTKNSVPGSSGYGSISLRYEDEIKEQKKASLQKTSNFPRFLAAIVLLTASLLLFFSGRATTNNSVDIPPNDAFLDTVEMLGEVHRAPEDTPRWYSQRRDHFEDFSYADTWQQRYYAQSKYFRGPGHPIFLVVGGEGGIDKGMFYPFVDKYLAERFGAYVLHPEHRFYGESQPVGPGSLTNDDLKKYLTTRQAILDMLSIVKTYQVELGCSVDRTSKYYCPVIAVGGSYPGFLAALMRLHYPDLIDIAYASSAPLLLYGMEADQFGYFDVISEVTDKASPGCQEAVKTTLAEVDKAIQASPNYVKTAHSDLNICPGTLPNYIQTNDILSKEVMMIAEYTFANYNMFHYPPGNNTDLAKLCTEVFQNDSLDSFGKMAGLWNRLEKKISPTLECFDMTSQLPDGPRAHISGSDWSGTGIGYDGMMFDFHCCSTLTPPVGFSHKSMFPYRKWTLEWLTEHCLDRFNVTPKPRELLKEFKFDDLVGQGASRILFTNGMNDMWHAGSYLVSLSDSIPVVNIANGAHHSDLTFHPKDGRDTKEMNEAHTLITAILEGWLQEIRADQN